MGSSFDLPNFGNLEDLTSRFQDFLVSGDNLPLARGVIDLILLSNEPFCQ